MSVKKKNLSDTDVKTPSVEGAKIAIVQSEWNKKITDSLAIACKEFLLSKNILEEDLKMVYVPGSFELPMGAKMLLNTEQYDAIICIGCIIKGETKHDEHIAQATAKSISQLSILSNIPIIFGVLTTEDEQQAIDRSGGKYGNKGIEAAQTAIKMIALKKSLESNKSTIGFV